MPDPSAIAGVPLPAPELPNATVSVRVVRERMGNNVAKHEVTLNVGDSPRKATTDEQGRAQFTGIAPGTIVQATTTVDGEVLTSQQFSVPASGGVRVALIAGIATAAAREKAAAEAAAREPARPGIVEIGADSRVVIEFQNDMLTVFYLLEVVNNARTPIDTGGPLLIELPSGAAGASVMQGSSQNVSVRGDMVTITGPFPPGKTIAQVGFSLPQAGESISIRQRWPAAMAQVFVGVEKIAGLQMSSPQLTDTREITTEQGAVFIMGTGGRISPGQELLINLSGMPAHSKTPRNIIMALAALIFAVGGWFAFMPAKGSAAPVDKLRARREKLMNEVVALERKRRQRPLSAGEEAKLQKMTAELERVIAELDSAFEPAATARQAPHA
ncbi:MAG TPA: hypothetical protein VJ691_09275 [Vicinamibacterales bacterium]|nr:hypothetical protein [Vicinamibacterales bacterium]